MSRFDNVEIPYGAYWSTPFAKWQGSLQHLHAGLFSAWVAKREMARRQVDPAIIDYGVVGQTVAQFQSFNAAAWLFSHAGMEHVAGPIVSQVCATGVRALVAAAAEVQMGMASAALALTADRISNGPHIYYPAPGGPGGTGQSEDQVLFNIANDPIAGHAMVQTAENVAARYGISTEAQHEIVLMRSAQYQEALADDRVFQKRYMTLPFEVPTANFRKIAAHLDGDEGITPANSEKLAALKPAQAGGTVTFAGQTHPADGNASIILAAADRAREMTTDPAIRVQILGVGQGRVELGYMPEAPAVATAAALGNAGLSMNQIDAVKSHNPFAVNDIVFAQSTGFPLEKMNNFGCSLIWGHPQGPTGTRAIIELIEELALRGGGTGLFQGCAAGDSGAAVIIKVSDRG